MGESVAGGAASGGGAAAGDWRDAIRAAHLGVLPAAGGGEGCADEGGVKNQMRLNLYCWVRFIK